MLLDMSGRVTFCTGFPRRLIQLQREEARPFGVAMKSQFAFGDASIPKQQLGPVVVARLRCGEVSWDSNYHTQVLRALLVKAKTLWQRGIFKANNGTVLQNLRDARTCVNENYERDGKHTIEKCLAGSITSRLSIGTAQGSCLWFDSRLRQNTLLFQPYLRRRLTEWGVGRSTYGFSYAKSCISQAFSQLYTKVASLSSTPIYQSNC